MKMYDSHPSSLYERNVHKKNDEWSSQERKSFVKCPAQLIEHTAEISSMSFHQNEKCCTFLFRVQTNNRSFRVGENLLRPSDYHDHERTYR